MKKCPHCAEDVQDAAIVCKHCGRDLAGKPLVVKVDHNYRTLALIGAVLFVVLVLAGYCGSA